jgi:UDP-N-acetylglucosamine--N-acetylmuramyl-(pentapeptide) pyrophosphoryl-undecaprenol N-acetylglucosamine transferase
VTNGYSRAILWHPWSSSCYSTYMEKQHRPLILFTGGGTGGHVYPGLAVLEELDTLEKYRFAWLGSLLGVEGKIVRRAGIPYYGILAGKLRRYFSLQNLWDIFKVIGGFFQALVLLMRLKPRLLFSKGGFVSVPPVLAAKILGIPVFSHESDFDPGLATKINLRSTTRQYVAYKESLRYFPSRPVGRVRFVGNPVREGLFSGTKATFTQQFPQAQGKQVLLVLGGSLGAQDLNDLVIPLLDRLKDFYLIHQTGQNPHPPESGHYFPRPFFYEELADILNGADIVISRAGAGSLWELAGLKKKMILVPLVKGSRGDQILNAKRLENHKTVRVLLEESDPEALYAAIQDLLPLGEGDYPEYRPEEARRTIAREIENTIDL